jgi:predicted  nucleic acid-binding Zn-ribbon protein
VHGLGAVFNQPSIICGTHHWPENLKEQVAKRDKTITQHERTIETGRRENADQKRRIEELEHELDAWKRRANDPRRGSRGLFR